MHENRDCFYTENVGFVKIMFGGYKAMSRELAGGKKHHVITKQPVIRSDDG